jgi:hypothetical protein
MKAKLVMMTGWNLRLAASTAEAISLLHCEGNDQNAVGPLLPRIPAADTKTIEGKAAVPTDGAPTGEFEPISGPSGELRRLPYYSNPPDWAPNYSLFR